MEAALMSALKSSRKLFNEHTVLENMNQEIGVGETKKNYIDVLKWDDVFAFRQ